MCGNSELVVVPEVVVSFIQVDKKWGVMLRGTTPVALMVSVGSSGGDCVPLKCNTTSYKMVY